MLQVPGELAGEETDVGEQSARFGLNDLEDLLDQFVALRPSERSVPVEVLAMLLDDFASSARALTN